MKLKITTVGNSAGVVLPKELLTRLRLAQADARHFRLEAEPVNAQAADAPCGTLSYDELGSRGASGTLGAACWR